MYHLLTLAHTRIIIGFVRVVYEIKKPVIYIYIYNYICTYMYQGH